MELQGKEYQINQVKQKMTRDQVVELFKMIKDCYDNFIVSTEKVNLWFEILKDYEFTKIRANLLNHIASSSYAPKVSDLIKKPKAEEISRAVPGVEETTALLNSYENKSPASAEYVKELGKKLREELGFK